MTIRALADTHALIWYIFGDSRLSLTARTAIDSAGAIGDQVALSAISFAEIVYLVERSRINATTLDQVLILLDRPNSVLIEVSFDRAVARTMRSIARSTIPELPDRMIAATAMYLGVPLISRDHKIQASGLTTVW